MHVGVCARLHVCVQGCKCVCKVACVCVQGCMCACMFSLGHPGSTSSLSSLQMEQCFRLALGGYWLEICCASVCRRMSGWMVSFSRKNNNRPDQTIVICVMSWNWQAIEITMGSLPIKSLDSFKILSLMAMNPLLHPSISLLVCTNPKALDLNSWKCGN